MADDDIDYIDDLLDAPFKQITDKTSSKARRRSPSSGDDVVVAKKSKDSNDKEKSHKSSRRSRSKDRHREKDRDKDKKKDEEKSKKRDDKRSRSRSKDKKSRDDKERKRSRSRGHEKRRRSRDVDKRKRSRSREERRSDRERKRSRSRDRVSRSKDYDRRGRDSRDDRRDKIRSRSKDKRRSYSPRPFRRGRTPPNGIQRSGSSEPEDLAPEERDARTIFCMQLAQRIKARDLEEFFSSVGKVRDVRLITCNKTKRFKGIAYVEFKDPESVALAMGLSGQRLLGIPIVVQHTQAEKNRLANATTTPPETTKYVASGPMRLYVGSLHFQVSEQMLEDIFMPFGRVDNIQLIRDPESGQSKGYGFITFHDAEDAEVALTNLNGFELAGRPMKVGNVTERLDVAAHASLDTDEMDRSGIDLGATGRLQLMCKLAEKTDLEIPQVTANALMASLPQPESQAIEEDHGGASTCFVLNNMFDLMKELESGDSEWVDEIRDDVIEECNLHGGVVHIEVIKTPMNDDMESFNGKVYVKCPLKATAVLAVNALNNRYFGGRVIKADFIPQRIYDGYFPEAKNATKLLKVKRV